MSVVIPVVSTIMLASNLFAMRSLPQLTGPITAFTIAGIVLVTLLNIVFAWLTFTDVTLGVLGLIVVNIIVVALGYKHIPYLWWAGMNMSPVAWMAYRIWF